jgi:SAM-dependent methyltransferase
VPDRGDAPGAAHEVLERELAYHERLYSGFAQQHFARPAVRALREHMVSRILRVTGAGKKTRVLSLGCGIGDTELLLAPHVAHLTGIDLSPAAMRQASEDAERHGIANVRFEQASFQDAAGHPAAGEFDLVIAIFFLHHLSDEMIREAPRRIGDLLSAGGVFYSLDPSRYRLSGAVGSLLIPNLMRKYQTEDERELRPREIGDQFRSAGFDTRTDFYDLVSSPLAGLFPRWRSGYQAARVVDNLLIRLPLVRKLGSNFEVIARRAR